MNDYSYKKIADEYLRRYGAGLRHEMEEIEKRQPTYITPSLDRRVSRGIAALKRPRYMRYAGLIAACLAIALLTPFILRLYPGRIWTPGPDEYSPAPTSSPATSSTTSPATSPVESPTTPPKAPTYEILPLSFKIPAQFQMASVEQDGEKTIYCLDDSMLDDVIITLERSGDISRYDTLTELPIGGYSAFGSSGNGYNLMAFIDEDSDILYVLTCKYDINTLVLLGESILI